MTLLEIHTSPPFVILCHRLNMTMPVFSQHSLSDSILSKKGLRNVPVSALIPGLSPTQSYFW